MRINNNKTLLLALSLLCLLVLTHAKGGPGGVADKNKKPTKKEREAHNCTDANGTAVNCTNGTDNNRTFQNHSHDGNKTHNDTHNETGHGGRKLEDDDIKQLFRQLKSNNKKEKENKTLEGNHTKNGSNCTNLTDGNNTKNHTDRDNRTNKNHSETRNSSKSGKEGNHRGRVLSVADS